MKRIVSAALLLMMLLAFTACDKVQTPTQNPSQSATENSEQTLVATETPTREITQETVTAPAVTATETPTTEITQETTTTPAITATAKPTIEITQAPTATVTPTLEITKKPTAAPTPTVKPIVDYSKYNIQTVSKLIYTSEYGWELGMGNSDNLKKAIDEIVALDFEFLNEFDFADTEEEIQEKAIQSITPILEKYDVYVYYILIYPGPLWSGEDENGSFISGQSVNMNIALGAGNMIANVKSQYD